MIRLFLAAALTQSGCSMLYGVEHIAGRSTSDWFTLGPVQKSSEEIMATTRDVIVRQGYVVGPLDTAERRVESNWDTHLSSHWREGNRTKLEAYWEPSGPGGYLIRVRSYSEINNNSKQPLSPQQAEWIGASLDKKWEAKMNDPAQRFLTMLKLRFFGLNQ